MLHGVQLTPSLVNQLPPRASLATCFWCPRRGFVTAFVKEKFRLSLSALREQVQAEWRSAIRSLGAFSDNSTMHEFL